MNIPNITTEPAATVIEPSSGLFDFVIRRVRYERILAQLALNQLEFVDAALNAGWISAEDAVAMLGEAGLDWILPTGAST